MFPYMIWALVHKQYFLVVKFSIALRLSQQLRTLEFLRPLTAIVEAEK